MRRPPRQKRSREMVERLLDATAATIVARGLDNTTTNHIAEQAGVSIGSLYQYFPDKEALVASLLERVARDITGNFRARADEVDITRFSLREIAGTAIPLGLAMIRSDPLLLELVRNWYRLPVDKVLDPLEHQFLVSAQPWFLRNFRDVPVRELDAKLYVVVSSAMLACIRYVLQEHPPVKEKAFVRAMTDMIVAALVPGSKPDIYPDKNPDTPGTAPA